MIKILMFDMNSILGSGIQAIINLEFDMEVIGDYKDKAELVNAIKENIPDILLVNTTFTNNEDFSAINWIKKGYPSIKIIFMMSKSNEDIFLRGIHIGVDGFLLYESEPSYLIESMRNIFKEEMVLSGKIAKLLIGSMISEEKKELLVRLREKEFHLTARESDLVYLIYKGFGNAEIANVLKLSDKTIRDYVSKLYKKLGIYSRKEVFHLLEQLMLEENVSGVKVLR
ncbi:response regulator transcription factor [Terribacillus aidingensis]|uniref:response regulator transcription factor n=1 Tax=Terribacillus aidingensis TaxID=586416 RepID=UPI00344DEA75